jgi:Uma2 family endonuclease
MMVMSKTTMKQANIRYNYNDYLLLPEGKRYEILDGELFMVPAPNVRHQRLSKKLAVALIGHTEARGLGEILYAPCDLLLSEENIVQPDILFVRKERLGIVGEANITDAPDLVVEILSPGTRNKDLELKRKIYARFGVQEYWIVDPEADTVEVLVWSELGYVATGIYRKADNLSSPLLPDLRLPLSAVFA